MSRPCPFCQIVREGRADTLVYAGPAVVAFLDRRPVFHGHTLVVPRQHLETLADVPGALAEPLLTVVQAVIQALEEVAGAEGTFVAANNRISQSVPHLHVHVVPRRRKDGLRGFFWPRHPYTDDAQREHLRSGLAAAVRRRLPD